MTEVTRYFMLALGQDGPMAFDHDHENQNNQDDQQQAGGSGAARDVDQVIVVGGESDTGADVTSQVEQPAKVMRIGTMIKQLLEEVRAAPLDEAGRARLKEIHESSIKELEDGLSADLRQELDRLSLPFDEGRVPSEAELRIAQAQLVGWLEGLFHGIQTALFAQQMAARAQLEQMRGRALPGQVGPGPAGLGGLLGSGDGEHGTGQYL